LVDGFFGGLLMEERIGLFQELMKVLNGLNISSSRSSGSSSSKNE